MLQVDDLIEPRAEQVLLAAVSPLRWPNPNLRSISLGDQRLQPRSAPKTFIPPIWLKDFKRASDNLLKAL
ncbi:hypothetical protein [Bradyrhizobium sp. Rc2d]|uniref:hypothetical protein n=1 Tax=Bradyrhizobium sp. Rc2d TaxID=1855321 RepID=UPI000B8530F5|nr:hypothetical protein [Bradyrhizobium sp. Rc2d]